MVRVWLFGAGPGLYLDLARLAFQVPTLLSAPQATTVKANAATSRLEMKKSLLRMFCSFPNLGAFVLSLPDEEKQRAPAFTAIPAHPKPNGPVSTEPTPRPRHSHTSQRTCALRRVVPLPY